MRFRHPPGVSLWCGSQDTVQRLLLVSSVPPSNLNSISIAAKTSYRFDQMSHWVVSGGGANVVIDRRGVAEGFGIDQGRWYDKSDLLSEHEETLSMWEKTSRSILCQL